MVQDIQTELRQLANPEIAGHSQRFFKTQKGEYGEGDIFLGIRVPVLRKLAKKYQDLPLADIITILCSKYHEERLFALILLVNIFKKGDFKNRKTVYTLYLAHTNYINNWDLVDVSAGHIVGAYLRTKDKQPLYILAESINLWERRIAIISTSHFIRHHEFSDALKLSKKLLYDTEDLIHKAVGWMLREIGKRDMDVEEKFLKKYYQNMPRTMLRYAIEKFPEVKRKNYLNGKI